MQTPSVTLNIGGDVGKDEMVVACDEGSFWPRKIANQRAALLSFLKGLPAGSHIGVESTGGYHELAAELAHKLGLVVYVLNPQDTRHYAKAMGLRGKTDRVDVPSSSPAWSLMSRRTCARGSRPPQSSGRS